MPTTADLAGATNTVPEKIDGISFVNELLGKEQKAHPFLYWAFYERGGATAVRAGKWKVVQQPIRTRPRLYNLDEDINEAKDLAAVHPDVLRKLVKEMKGAYKPSPRWQFPNKKKR